MKSCPTCNRTYPDDTLAFCLMDGSVLSAPYDPKETRREAVRRTDDSRTEVLPARTKPDAARQPLLPSTIQAPQTAPASLNNPQSTLRVPTPQAPLWYEKEGSASSATSSTQAHWLLRSALAMRGVSIVLFAILRLIWPAATIITFLFISSAEALIGGTVTIVAGYKAYSDFKTGWLLIVDGVLGVIAVALLLTSFQLRFAGFGALYVLLMITGAVRIGAAFQLRKHLKRTWLLATAGVVSTLNGFALLFTLFFLNSYRYTGVPAYILAYGIVLGSLWMAFGLLTRQKIIR